MKRRTFLKLAAMSSGLVSFGNPNYAVALPAPIPKKADYIYDATTAMSQLHLTPDLIRYLASFNAACGELTKNFDAREKFRISPENFMESFGVIYDTDLDPGDKKLLSVISDEKFSTLQKDEDYKGIIQLLYENGILTNELSSGRRKELATQIQHNIDLITTKLSENKIELTSNNSGSLYTDLYLLLADDNTKDNNAILITQNDTQTRSAAVVAVAVVAVVGALYAVLVTIGAVELAAAVHLVVCTETWASGCELDCGGCTDIANIPEVILNHENEIIMVKLERVMNLNRGIRSEFRKDSLERFTTHTASIINDLGGEQLTPTQLEAFKKIVIRLSC